MLPRLAVLLLVAWSSVAVGGEWDAKHLGFTGISIQGNEELLKKLGFAKLPAKRGILVTVVNPGTATAAGGLLPMAIVTTVNKKPVGNLEDVQAIIDPLPLGEDAAIGGYSLRNNVWKSGTVKSKVSTRKNVLSQSMEKTVDKIEGHVVYEHRFDVPQLKRLRYYVVERKDEEPQLVMQVIYAADEWIFVNAITAAHSGSKVTIPLKPFGGNDKIVKGGIIEKHWAAVTPEFAELTKHIDCTIRFEGKNNDYDHEQTLSEFWVNRDVMDFYRMVTEKP